MNRLMVSGAFALALLAAGAVAATKAPAEKSEKQKVTLPILAWNGGDCKTQRPKDVAYFAELREAGFTVTMEDAATPEAARALLDAAQQADMKLCLRSKVFSNVKSTPEEIKAFADKVKDHPALEMYYVRDEPRHINNDFPNLAQLIANIKAADPNHRLYVNGFGCDANQVWWATKTYEDYVRAFFDELKLDWFSFDLYPITPKGSFFKSGDDAVPFKHDGIEKELKAKWFDCLEQVRRICAEKNAPFSAFALSVPHRNSGHWDYPPHSVGELKLELYAGLLYGAQSLQHFTYRTPTPQGEMKFHNGPLAYESGLRTPMYDRVRAANSEIQSRAFVFKNAKVETVGHVGEPIPQGAKAFDLAQLPAGVKSLEVTDGTALISVLKKGKATYLAVLNTELVKEITLKVAFAGAAKRIRADGTREETERRDGIYWLGVGDCEIFKLPK